jgi:YggT family protein
MLASLLLMLIQAYIIILIIRSIMSWFPNVDYRNPLVKLVYDLTEPVLRPVRERVGVQNGIDFSPILVFIGLYVLSIMIQRLL